MKKVISVLTLDRPVNLSAAYPANFSLDIPGVKNSIPANICLTDLSSLIKNQGEFKEGKIKISPTNEVYFHWSSFALNNTSCDLYTDPVLEAYMASWDKRFPQGLLTNEEIKKIRFANPQFDPFIFGISAEKLFVPNTIMISDVSNYPWNFGFFIIKDGRLFDTDDPNLKGKHWVLAYTKSGSLKPRLISLDYDEAKKKNIITSGKTKDIKWGLYLNPVIFKGRPMTSLTAQIPKTKETLVHSFRGGTAHIFKEEQADKGIFDIEKSQKLATEILKSKNKVTPELEALLKEAGPFPVKRGTMGHTVFGVTKSNKLIVFKTFNPAKKDKGVLLEQVGPLMKGISAKLGEEVIFAGIGANGGDPRTFLGVSGKYKNTPEDNPQIRLQEKITDYAPGQPARILKPILLHIKTRQPG
jgi:hypothetical protein